MYLRETKRRNKDGTTVSTARVVHNFGRADQVDRDALARLVRSIARVLQPAEAVAALEPGDVSVVDGRDLGGAWVLDQLWTRLGIGAAIAKVAAGRRVDASVERVLFALVANRALAPSSKLEATRWVAEEVAIPGLDRMDHTSCYRAMDFLLDALDELQRTVFFTVADLLTSTSTCCSSTPPRHISRSTRPTRRLRAATPKRGSAPMVSPRTTGPTCRRWSSAWPSPAAGSPCAYGPGRATPKTRP